MRIAVLGTGTVGQAHIAALSKLGHEVLVGTRSPKEHKIKGAKAVSFADAAKEGEVVIEALNGRVALKVLKPLKTELAGKILIDISNPLDFSKGYMRLTVVNDDSLGEQIQKALPKTKVVKAFNTTNASVQVSPQSVAKGDHHLFIAGNDAAAKAKVIKLAKQWYGWQHIIDLGNISGARGMEMVLPLWLKIMQAKGTASYNFKIAK